MVKFIKRARNEHTIIRMMPNDHKMCVCVFVMDLIEK